MRGGATIFGPVVRSHETVLPKKVRKLALRHALSSKQKEGALFIIENAEMKKPQTKAHRRRICQGRLGQAATIIDGKTVDEGFAKAARNIKYVDVLPGIGANVYDILRHKQLVLTKDAVAHLEERLK